MNKTVDVFHLGLAKQDLQGATLAIVPGDPDRVKKIAELMDNPRPLASHREFTSWLAELNGKPRPGRSRSDRRADSS